MYFAVKRGPGLYAKCAALALAAVVCILAAAGGNLLAWLALAPVLLVSVVSAAQLLRGGYYLGDGLMELKCGLQTLLVQYNQIEQVSQDKTLPADGYVPFALGPDKLCVYYQQEGKSYRLELSPADMQGFIRELSARL